MPSKRNHLIRAASVCAAAAVLAISLLSSAGTATAGGGGCHERPSQAEGSGTVVSITYGCFTPTVLHVAAGANVEFENNDVAVHALSGVGDAQPIADKLAPGSVATRTFPTEGIYPYYCNLHFGMAGVIVVGAASLEGEAVAASYTNAATGSPTNADDSRASSPGDTAQQAAPSSVTSPADDDGLPGLAIAGLGALVGLVAATGIAAPIAYYRGRRG